MKALLNKQPPTDHRLLVMGTATERTVIQELGLYQAFDQKIPIPNINTEEDLKAVIAHSEAISNPQLAVDELKKITGSDIIGVGIKSILLAIDTAKQDRDREQRFAQTIADIRAESEYV